MTEQLIFLLGTAAVLGAVHTILGPDHYLPFIMISRARSWSLPKTALITVLCGVGHVGSSILLGLIGIAAGITLRKLEIFESARGDIAAWLLMAFGLAYGAWGLSLALRNRPHTHQHLHVDGTAHAHAHTHSGQHAHPHDQSGRRLTPWILFTIFVFGPCEPLIPLLMYPAAQESTIGVVLVASVFSLVTIATMTAAVLIGRFGANLIPHARFARFGHAIAGAVVFLCGVAVRLGL